MDFTEVIYLKINRYCFTGYYLSTFAHEKVLMKHYNIIAGKHIGERGFAGTVETLNVKRI
jgi:hypothetical protein